MLLALDTSSDYTGIALYDGTALLAESIWRASRRQTAQLMPHLRMLLQHAGVQPEAIDSVAVALGPGSWSGLRVGLSVAKGWAVSGNARIIGVGSLDILAYPFRPYAGFILPVIRLGRDRFASAVFRSGASLHQVGETRNSSMAEIPMPEADTFVVTLGMKQDEQQALRARFGRLVRFPEEAEPHVRPRSLALMAWERLQRGQIDDPVLLEPIYLGEAVRVPPAATS